MQDFEQSSTVIGSLKIPLAAVWKLGSYWFFFSPDSFHSSLGFSCCFGRSPHPHPFLKSLVDPFFYLFEFCACPALPDHKAGIIYTVNLETTYTFFSFVWAYMQFPTLVAIAFVFVLCYSTTWSQIEDGRFSAVPISIVGISKLSFSCFIKAL